MPTFSCSTDIWSPSSDDPSLRLHTRHFLVFQSPSSRVKRVNANLPQDVDIILASHLAITLAGVLNRVQVPAKDVARSAVARHLRQFFELKLIVVVCQCVRHYTVYYFHALLDAGSSRLDINITYYFNSRTHKDAAISDADTIFSSMIALPLASVLNKVVDQFVTQLVRRYPLIFGSWPKQMDAEMPWMAPLVRSCLQIMKRSPNPSSRLKFKALIESMREQHDIAYTSTLVSLSQMLHSIDDHPDLESPSSLTEGMTSEEILQLSLEAYLRRTMRPTPFKGVFRRAFDDSDQEGFRSVEEFFSDVQLDQQLALDDILSGQDPEIIFSEGDDYNNLHWFEDEMARMTSVEDWPIEQTSQSIELLPLVIASSTDVSTDGSCPAAVSVPTMLLRSQSPSHFPPRLQQDSSHEYILSEDEEAVSVQRTTVITALGPNIEPLAPTKVSEETGSDTGGTQLTRPYAQEAWPTMLVLDEPMDDAPCTGHDDPITLDLDSDGDHSPNDSSQACHAFAASGDDVPPFDELHFDVMVPMGLGDDMSYGGSVGWSWESVDESVLCFDDTGV